MTREELEHVIRACALYWQGCRVPVGQQDWGGDCYRRDGVMMPADGLGQLRGSDAILFGLAGDGDIADHITLIVPAPEGLPRLRPVLQRAAETRLARHREPAQALRPAVEIPVAAAVHKVRLYKYYELYVI